MAQLESATGTLLALADQFEAQGAYAQAVKCLTPLCSDSSGELPAVVAQARLRLALLLLAHFDNVQEAKATLLSAQEQELRQTQGHHLLKCEVWDALARCQRQLGAVSAEQSALAAGLRACQQGATSKDREVLSRWRAYFHFRLAEHTLVHSGPEAAAGKLCELEGDAQLALTPVERALRLLCCATLALARGDAEAAGPLLQEATAAIEEAGQGDPALHRHLRCHYAVLFVGMAVAGGRVNSLQLDGSGIVLLAQLQQQLAEAGGGPWSYTWLPPAAVGAVGNLLHASLLRSLGKASPAAACLAAATEAVEQQLAALDIDMEGVESQLGVAAIWEGRIFCHLHVLLAEQRVVAALLASRFAEAAGLLGGLTALLARFPALLREFVPTTQLLLGHYAQSVQQYEAASQHFQAVLRSDAAQLHDSAAVAAAVAELQRDPAGPGGLRRASELLDQRGMKELPHVLGLPVHDRTTALVTNALVAQRTGDLSNATLMLTKALKTAHTHLGNTQMVAQVLNVLGPLQGSKGDRSGAEQMLNSALTLGKAQGDLSTVLAASRSLQTLLAGTPGQEERAATQAAYSERKEGELGERMREGTAAEHAALLTWRSPRQA